MINKSMNYKKHYATLIERARHRVLEEYTEKHHIIPRCLGGTDDKENIVALTPEEHYVAHQLLVKMYPKEHKLIYAANMMTVISPGNASRSNNKRYKWLKKKYISVCRSRSGSKSSSYGKPWYHNPETLENGKFLKENVPTDWIKGRKIKQKCCIGCLVKINTSNAKWCDSCRPKSGRNNNSVAYREKQGKQCVVNGVVFKAVSIAADSLGIGHETMRCRIKSINFPEYYYLKE
jgi:hypothetical protein